MNGNIFNGAKAMTARDIAEYAEECGNRAAADLLLLAGPDRFDGDIVEYNELMELYERGGNNENL